MLVYADSNKSEVSVIWLGPIVSLKHTLQKMVEDRKKATTWKPND